ACVSARGAVERVSPPRRPRGGRHPSGLCGGADRWGGGPTYSALAWAETGLLSPAPSTRRHDPGRVLRRVPIGRRAIRGRPDDRRRLARRRTVELPGTALPHVLWAGWAARGNARGLLSPPVYAGTLCGRAGRGQEHPGCDV